MVYLDFASYLLTIFAKVCPPRMLSSSPGLRSSSQVRLPMSVQLNICRYPIDFAIAFTRFPGV